MKDYFTVNIPKPGKILKDGKKCAEKGTEITKHGIELAKAKSAKGLINGGMLMAKLGAKLAGWTPNEGDSDEAAETA